MAPATTCWEAAITSWDPWLISCAPARTTSMSTSTPANRSTISVFFWVSNSARPAICSRSMRTTAIWRWTLRTMSLTRSALVPVSRARLRMSDDTVAKPRPPSPTRAASTAPLTASMVVWTETREMESTSFSMVLAASSSSPMLSTSWRV